MQGKLTYQFKQQLLEEVKVLIKKSKEEVIMDLYHFNRQRIEDKHELTDKLVEIRAEMDALKKQKSVNCVKNMEQKGKCELTDDASKIRESRQNQEIINRVRQSLQALEKRVDVVESRDNSTLKMKELSNEVLSLKRGLQEKIAHFSENFMKLQSTLVDHRSKHYWRFQIKDRLIQLRGNEGSTHFQLLGRIPISKKSVNHFTVYSNWFECGIVDKRYIGQENSWNRKECIIYTSQGKVFISGKNQSKKQPISYGAKLTMAVQDNRITWKVNGQLKNSCLNALINNPSINWVPFIKLSQEGTKVLWE